MALERDLDALVAIDVHTYVHAGSSQRVRRTAGALPVVVPTPDTPQDGDALRATLRRRLAGSKVPSEVRYVPELPRTATGKIRKPDQRQPYVLTEEDA